jgi:hypothetical protein
VENTQLLADFWSHEQVAEQYGIVLDEDDVVGG